MRTFAVIVLFAASPAHATTTRLLALGLDNWQIRDSANFWTNPALLRDAPDLVQFEVGTQAAEGNALTAGSQWGGFHKAWGRNVFAFYVRRPYATADFDTTGDPMILPSIGGQITANNVLANANLDTGGKFTANNGPFNTGTGALGITGAPNVAKDIAVPVNYFDAFYALSLGKLGLGIRFNFAFNAPGEVRRTYYDNRNSGGGATEGTVLLERSSKEFNLQPGFVVQTERVRWDVVGHISMPFYSVRYDETGASGAIDGGWHRVRISDDNTLGGDLATQLSVKVGDVSSIAFHVRIGDQNVAGIASERTDSDGNGVLETDRVATFDNRRRYLYTDFTWNRLFEKALLVASIGYQRHQVKQTWGFTDALGAVANEQDMSKSDRDIVPMRIGLEMVPWERVALRAGVQKNWFAETDTKVVDGDADRPPLYTHSSTAIAERAETADGVGLSFGAAIQITPNLSVDTVVRQEFFFDGPDFIGGQAQGLFARGTLVYRFGDGGETEYYRLKPLFFSEGSSLF